MYAKREDKRTEYEERYKKDLSSPDRDVFSTNGKLQIKISTEENRVNFSRPSSSLQISSQNGAAVHSREAVNKYHKDEQRQSFVIQNHNDNHRPSENRIYPLKSSSENRRVTASVNNFNNDTSSRKRRNTYTDSYKSKHTKPKSYSTGHIKRVELKNQHRHGQKIRRHSTYENKNNSHRDYHLNMYKKTNYSKNDTNASDKHYLDSSTNHQPGNHYVSSRKVSSNSFPAKTKHTPRDVKYSPIPERPGVPSPQKDLVKFSQPLPKSNSHSPVSVRYLSSSDDDRVLRIQLLKDKYTDLSKNKSSELEINHYVPKNSNGKFPDLKTHKIKVDENIWTDRSRYQKDLIEKPRKRTSYEKCHNDSDDITHKSLGSISRHSQKSFIKKGNKNNYDNKHDAASSSKYLLPDSKSHKKDLMKPKYDPIISKKSKAKCKKKTQKRAVTSSSSSSSSSSSQSSRNSKTSVKQSRWNSGSSEGSSNESSEDIHHSKPLGPPLADKLLLEKVKPAMVENMIRQRNCKYCALHLKTKEDVTRHIMTQRHKVVTGEFFLDHEYLIGMPYKGDKIQCTICNAALNPGESVEKHEGATQHHKQLHRWMARGQPLPIIKFYIDCL